MATLAEGVARLIEKQVSSQHARHVDDVTISPRPPGVQLRAKRGPVAEAAAASPAPPVRTLDLSELRGESKEAVDVLLRQETSRTAFRSMYRQRVSTFQQTLEALEEDVARELEAMPRPEVVVGVRGRENTQIVITRAGLAEPEAGAGPAALAFGSAALQPPSPFGLGGPPSPSGPAARSSASASASASSGPLTKAVLRDGLVWAAGRALAELGVHPEQPFSAGLAVQVLSHPQLRPLVLVALPDGIQRARESDVAQRARGAAGDGGGTPEGESGAASPATRTLTRKSRPRKKAPLVRVVVKRPRA
jgi:hypothetical protein